MRSEASVRYENGKFELQNLETDIGSYEIMGDRQTGINRGYFPPGAQVHSTFDVLSGSFSAHGEGHITNESLPGCAPQYLFSSTWMVGSLFSMEKIKLK